MRIVRKIGIFEKGFTPNWSEAVFTITAVKSIKPPTYTIGDILGEPVQETFYEPELQSRVQEIYRIERAQEGKRPSACQVERIQQCVQFVDTISRP